MLTEAQKRVAQAIGSLVKAKESERSGETDVATVPSTPPESPQPEETPAPEGEERSPAEDARIPKQRLDDVIAQREAAERRAAEAEAKLKQQGALDALEALLAEDRRPEGWAEWSETKQQAWIAREGARIAMEDIMGPDQAKELGRVMMERRVLQELGEALTPAQLSAVADIRAESPKLSAKECKALAAIRHNSLFQGSKATPSMPASHRTTPGGEGARDQKPKTTEQTARERMRTARTQGDHARAAASWLGEALVKPGEKNRLAAQGWKR